MRILACGSRSWTDMDAIREVFDGLDVVPTEVIHGGARGADYLAGLVARERGIKVLVYPARWDLHGKSAGFKRNQKMVDSGVQLVLAFHADNSPGTADTIRRAREAGIEVRIFTPRPEAA